MGQMGSGLCTGAVLQSCGGVERTMEHSKMGAEVVGGANLPFFAFGRQGEIKLMVNITTTVVAISCLSAVV